MTKSLREVAHEFLTLKRIAIVGVSHDRDEAANFVFRKLREAGYDVFAVNPTLDLTEGAPCHPSLHAIPGGVEGAVVFTPPSASGEVVRECAELGVRHVWLHRAMGEGSFSEEAVAIAREHNLTLIPGGCPAMFCKHADLPHRCMRWLLGVAGRLPRAVESPGSDGPSQSIQRSG